MLVQCGSSLGVPVGTPSVSLPVSVWEGFFVPAMLLSHVLLHSIGGPGHADFFLHVAGDSWSREMQLDSARWQNGNHCAVCVGASCQKGDNATAMENSFQRCKEREKNLCCWPADGVIESVKNASPR
mgnify:CR=1 FL=1